MVALLKGTKTSEETTSVDPLEHDIDGYGEIRGKTDQDRKEVQYRKRQQSLTSGLTKEQGDVDELSFSEEDQRIRETFLRHNAEITTISVNREMNDAAYAGPDRLDSIPGPDWGDYWEKHFQEKREDKEKMREYALWVDKKRTERAIEHAKREREDLGLDKDKASFEPELEPELSF